MPDVEGDRIRLSLPADADLGSVVEVAVAIVSRRLGLSEVEVNAGRAALGEAFAELVSAAAASTVEVELQLGSRRVDVRLTSGADSRAVAVGGTRP